MSDLKRRLDLTVLFVTHDLAEAYSLADRIVVYDDGQVLQHGTREDVFRRPVSSRVAELTEVRNILPGTIRAFAEGVAVVETPWFTARVRDDDAIVRGDVYVCIRPEHIIVLKDGHEARDTTDTVIEVEIIDEEATANNHRLFMRTVAPPGSRRRTATSSKSTCPRTRTRCSASPPAATGVSPSAPSGCPWCPRG